MTSPADFGTRCHLQSSKARLIGTDGTPHPYLQRRAPWLERGLLLSSGAIRCVDANKVDVHGEMI